MTEEHNVPVLNDVIFALQTDLTFVAQSRQVRGDVATRYSWREREIDVRVRVVDEQRASPEQIGQLVVNPDAERPVTLDAVADIDIAVGPGEIRRTGQQRVAVVSARTNFGDLGSAAEEAQQIVSGIPMPRGLSVRVAGQSDEMQRAFRSLLLALALIAALGLIAVHVRRS